MTIYPFELLGFSADDSGYSVCFSWFRCKDGFYIVISHTPFGRRGFGVVDDFGSIVEVKP